MDGGGRRGEDDRLAGSFGEQPLERIRLGVGAEAGAESCKQRAKRREIAASVERRVALVEQQGEKGELEARLLSGRKQAPEFAGPEPAARACGFVRQFAERLVAAEAVSQGRDARRELSQQGEPDERCRTAGRPQLSQRLRDGADVLWRDGPSTDQAGGPADRKRRS